MRDTNRIGTVIKEIEVFWSNNQNLRFAQIIEIIKRRTGREDMFYVEDTEILKILRDINEEK